MSLTIRSIIVFCILLNNNIWANDKSFIFTNYTIADGLADNRLHDIVKDDQGYIWLASQNGITRFDGSNFIVFNKAKNRIFFSKNEVNKLYKSKDKIYLISFEEGILELSPKDLSFKKIIAKGARSLCIKGDTTAILYSDGLLEIKKGTSKLHAKYLNFENKDDIIMKGDKIYVSSFNQGIYEFNLSNLNQTNIFKKNKNESGYIIYPSLKYGIVLNIIDELFFINKENKLEPVPEIKNNDIVTSYSESQNGDILYLTANKKTNLKFNTSFYEYVDKELPNVELRKILSINNDCIFICSNQGLIVSNKLHYDYIKHIDDNSFFKENTLRVRRKILPHGDDLIYFFGFPVILEYNIKTGNSKFLNEIDKPISVFDAIIIESIIYCATEGRGLISYDLKSKKLSENITSDIKIDQGFYHISRLNDSLLVLGGIGNIVLYDYKNKIVTPYTIGNFSRIYDISYDKSSRLYWVATDIGLISFILKNNGTIEFTKKMVLTNNPVKDIFIEDEKKQIWLGTNHGLELRKTTDLSLVKVYKNKNEISNPIVVGIQKDKLGKIWVSTYSGITIIDESKNKTYFINKSNGLKNVEYNYKSYTNTNDTKFIFGGINMYDIVDPNILNSKNYIDKFHITGILKTSPEVSHFYSFHTSNSKNIGFNTGKEDISIFLSNFDYNKNSGYKFEYQIGNNQWVPVENNIIRLSNLSYGRYTVKIRMFNPLGMIADEQKFQLNAMIPFYKTNLFLVVIILIISLLSILSFYLYLRIKNIENKTRERIAMDLHDEVGTTLTRLLMQLNKMPLNSPLYESIKIGLSDALFSIRAFINSMNGQKLDILSFKDDIREFMSNAFRNTEVKHFSNFKIPGNFKINQELYRDMKLCVNEAISNIIKHSDAKNVTLDLSISDKTIFIKITDDSNTKLSDIHINYGNGITNMKKRTERHQGSFELTDKEQKGIEILFNFDTHTLNDIR